MKKYWQLLVLSAVIVVAISTYYIQGASALKLPTPVALETVAGDEGEVDSLVMRAALYDDYIGHSFYLTKDGVIDGEEQHAFAQSLRPYRSPIIHRYVTDYRSFMRGKNYEVAGFVESETHVTNVMGKEEISKIHKGEPITYVVSTLDKATQEATSFEVAVPAAERYSWHQVFDVYRADGQIKFLVEGYFEQGGSDLQLYTVDEKSQQLIQSDTLAHLMAKSNQFAEISIYTPATPLGNEQYYLYDSRLREYDEGKTPRVTERHLYHIATGEVEKLQLPMASPSHLFLQGNEIFAFTQKASGLELYRYSIEEKQWQEPVTVEFTEDIALDSGMSLQQHENKWYVVTEVVSGQKLYVFDEQSGAVLYEGQFVLEGYEKLASPYDLYIEQMYFE